MLLQGFGSHLEGQCEFPRILSLCDIDVPLCFNILTLKSSDLTNKGNKRKTGNKMLMMFMAFGV